MTGHTGRVIVRRRLIPLAAAVFVLWPAGAAEAIVGGEAVPAGQRPYVANVLLGGQLACSGSLIAPTWVLTAGHCASITGAASSGMLDTPVLFPASFFTVRLNTVQTDGAGGESFTVKRVVINPMFSAVSGAYSYDNSLLELDHPSTVTPVKLAGPAERASWAAGQPVVEAGFGTTSEGSDEKPPTMRQTTVAVTADDVCAKAYPFDPVSAAKLDGEFDAKTMVCAGLPEGGKDVCEGDSGGPLLATVPGGVRVVGTTSTGNGCARPGYPSIFGRVGADPLRAWIASVVPDAIGTPAAAVTVSGLRASPLRFRARTGGGTIGAGTRSLHAGGTRLRFQATGAVRATITVTRGARVLARASHVTVPGANVVLLTGRRLAAAGRHVALAAGVYRVTVSAGASTTARNVRVLTHRR